MVDDRITDDNRVYVYSLAGVYPIVLCPDQLTITPRHEGIASDGSSLYVVDDDINANDDKVYVYSLAGGVSIVLCSRFR